MPTLVCKGWMLSSLHLHVHPYLYWYLYEDLDFYVVFEDPIKMKEFPCRKMSENITIARK